MPVTAPPTIPTLPTAPARGVADPDTYVDLADDWAAAQQPWSTKIGETSEWIEDRANEIQANADAVQTNTDTVVADAAQVALDKDAAVAAKDDAIQAKTDILALYGSAEALGDAVESATSSAGVASDGAFAAGAAAETAVGARDVCIDKAEEATNSATQAGQYAVKASAGSYLFDFVISTSDADPGAGGLALDNADPTMAEWVYINDEASNGTPVADWIVDFGSSTTENNKGRLYVSTGSDGTSGVYRVTGSIVSATGYSKVPVEWVSGDFAPEAADTVGVAFNPTGDVGVATGTITTVTSMVTDDYTLTTTYLLVPVQMSASGKAVTLASATGKTPGGPIYIVDNSLGAYSVGVRNSAGTLLTSVAAGNVVSLSLVDNTTSAGVWSVSAQSLPIGGVVDFPAVPSANWLPCTGLNYLNASYPALAALMPAYVNTATVRVGSITSTSKAAYGNGIYVVFGQDGSGYCCWTSTDRVTWTRRASPISADPGALEFGNGLFVLGQGTAMYSSPDCVTWTAVTTSGLTNISAIRYANSIWVAGGRYGGSSMYFATSPADLSAWSLRAGASLTGSPAAIAYNPVNGVWVAFGNSSYNLYSTDNAASWNQLPGTGTAGSGFLEWIGTRFIGIAGNTLTYHPTGGPTGNWSGYSKPAIFTGSLAAMIYDGARLIMTDSNGIVGISSDAGATWTQLGSISTPSCTGMIRSSSTNTTPIVFAQGTGGIKVGLDTSTTQFTTPVVSGRASNLNAYIKAL